MNLLTCIVRGPLGVAVMLGAMAGCGDDKNANQSSGLDGSDAGTAKYAISTVVTGPNSSRTGYVTVLDSLAPQGKLPLSKAREFPGAADMWVYQGSVFVSGGDSPTITKFTVADDGSLVQQAALSFAAYGITNSAFWFNTFISPTKAYMVNGTSQYVIWNPDTMSISGTIPFPALDTRDGLVPRAAFTDRGNVVSGGRLYQPIYWTDEAYARRTDDSRIAVFDVATDKLVSLLEAPCPGLDVGTIDDAGNLYFSNYTGGAGTYWVLHTASNCVAKVVPDTLAVSVEFKFSDLTGGHEGAIFHYVGNGRFVFSAFHEERVDLNNAAGPFDIVGGNDWRIWSYDSQTKQAVEMQSIDWDSGAAYWFSVDGTMRGLIPTANYAASVVYDLGTTPDGAKRLFDLDGMAVRLFKVR